MQHWMLHSRQRGSHCLSQRWESRRVVYFNFSFCPSVPWLALSFGFLGVHLTTAVKWLNFQIRKAPVLGMPAQATLCHATSRYATLRYLTLRYPPTTDHIYIYIHIYGNSVYNTRVVYIKHIQITNLTLNRISWRAQFAHSQTHTFTPLAASLHSLNSYSFIV